MWLWISFALLAAAVATLLLKSAPETPASAAFSPDVAVYKDQIDELSKDAQRGTIDPEQASAARAEIGRRLLKQADADAEVRTPKKQTFAAENVLLAGAAAVPVLSLMLYVLLGSPSLPDRPLATRLAEAPNANAPVDMVAKVEARLREKPDDGQGWAVIAPVYLSLGRAADSAAAYAKAINLVGETPDRLLGLAKANIIAGNGTVNELARKAFARLVELDPTSVEAKYWLAVFEEQNGRSDTAASAYASILASGPADAPWRKPVEQRLAAVLAKSGPPVPTPQNKIVPPVLAPAAGAEVGGSSKGPTPTEFVAAAQKLAPEMRELMIGRMIAKATDAVKQNPIDLSAWSRLITGHMALQKSAEANAAFKEAKLALSKDTKALAELDALKKSFALAD